MSKVIISAVATVAAVIAMAGTITWSAGTRSAGAGTTPTHDGYYITELRKADRLPFKK